MNGSKCAACTVAAVLFVLFAFAVRGKKKSVQIARVPPTLRRRRGGGRCSDGGEVGAAHSSCFARLGCGVSREGREIGRERWGRRFPGYEKRRYRAVWGDGSCGTRAKKSHESLTDVARGVTIMFASTYYHAHYAHYCALEIGTGRFFSAPSGPKRIHTVVVQARFIFFNFKSSPFARTIIKIKL